MPQFLRHVLVVGLLSAMATGIGACAQPKPQEEETHLPMNMLMADHTPYIDIPIPIGFMPAADPLTYAARRPPRVCHLRYAGGTEYVTVSRFYFESLPQLGWKLQMQQGGSVVNYMYTKGSETLEVTILPEHDVTEVIIKVQPTDTLNETTPAQQ